MKMQRIFLICLSIILTSTEAQEGSNCLLPNSTQSTCTRLHLCESFTTMIKNANGKPSTEQIENLKKHSCEGNNLVCCPDNAVTTTFQSRMNVNEAVSLPESPKRSDLDAIKIHKNFNLINDRKCGMNRVIDQTISEPKTYLGEFPWIALLQFKARLGDSYSFNCAGTLITPLYVLTVAHCVTRDLVSVRLGEHKITSEEDCDDLICSDPVQNIPVDKAIRHANFSSMKKNHNDIALLRLKTPADISGGFVKTICLPVTPETQLSAIEQTAREQMKIAGWGKLGSSEESDEMLKAFVPFVDRDNCTKRFGGNNVAIYETNLCAGGGEKGVNTNIAESGGPILSSGVVNKKPKSILYGVKSTTPNSLSPEVIYPEIYTNIAYYLEWILNNIS